MKAAQLKFSDIDVGNVYEFSQKISREQGETFAELSGDTNPLHVDPDFGKKSKFGKNVVHGMLAGSLFSKLVGMYCPGENCLYLSQTLEFKNPIFYDDTITVRGTVMKKSDSIQLIELKTEILKDGKAMVAGQAKVQVVERA